MLKRYQVLLENWQEDYIRYSADKLDLSFSEVVRILLSEAILSLRFSLGPEIEAGISQKELTEIKRRILNPKIETDEKHKLISEVYFEARKASESRIES